LPIVPDAHHDWTKPREADFDQFIAIGDKKAKLSKQIFENYSMGIKSNRDDWVYNYSSGRLSENASSMIAFFNSEVKRLAGIDQKELEKQINRDKTKIKWTSDLVSELAHGKAQELNLKDFRQSNYRPFTKLWSYFNASWNWTRHLMPSFFPTAESTNLVISVTGLGATKGFCAFVMDTLPDLEVVSKGQCFPLYLYEKSADASSGDGELFATAKSSAGTTHAKRDGISDAGLAHFQAAYPAEKITKEDLFYYIYGLLHSPDYRTRYADNLSKELPRIPAVKNVADFRAFTQAGRDLAHWHLDYETVAIYAGATLDTGKTPVSQLKPNDYRVTKMKFAKTKDATGKSVADKTTVIYNERITIRNIPLEAYDYVVNGKPALEWVMERQSVTTDKDSGIVNDANLWATETMGNARYPLELFQRVITVSLETMKIVKALPAIKEQNKPAKADA
jgi:predicted helicase